ncbi:MAG: TonB-dependent receptor [Acidobacteriota bacterium]|nr:TonB-dependent receptor [Acidobacteriota bacterium]
MPTAVLFAAFLRLVGADVPRISESVTVMSFEVPRVSTTATSTTLTRSTLDDLPSLTLDQKLGSVPGFSLFRRSSSRTANPTTQGVTLRGLSASGASRALVMLDDTSINDPFGGWVYWNRIPAAAIARVETARGGSSDLFGSDALGGAIRIVSRRDEQAEVRLDAGNQATARMSAYAGLGYGPPFRISGGVERFSTDGYVLVAPESRGPSDTPASSRHTSGVFRVAAYPGGVDVEAGGSWLGESRHNSTALQTNQTAIGSGFVSVTTGIWSAGLDFQQQEYDQTFSSVTAGRSVETLTTLQNVESGSIGARARTFAQLGPIATTLSLAARQTEATLAESRVSASVPGALAVTEARQRSASAAIQGQWQSKAQNVTVDGGLRAELWASRDIRLPQDEQRVGFVAPRLSAAWRVSPMLMLRTAAFSSYRAPTMNELYRGFRVGDVVTLSNPALDPERVNGAEAAVTFESPAYLAIRLVGFMSRLEGAIYSRTLTSGVPGITRMRTNGEARSAGVELEVESRAHKHAWVWVSATMLDSSFTSGELEGNRLPQVPRRSVTAGARFFAGRLSGSLEARHSARQFDDDRNQFELAPATTMNGQVAARFEHAQVFASVENIFDAAVEAGRTPLLTLGQPRMWQVGLRLFTR